MNIDSKRKAELLTAAIKERRTLRAWEKSGADPATRPETPAIDEIEEVQSMPKSDRKSRKSSERTPPAIDEEIRKLFVDGTIKHPATKSEIAAALDVPRSSAGHGCTRLAASGEMTVTQSPLRFWLNAAGAPNPVPVTERKARARKVYAVKGKAGKTHAATAARGENGTEYTVLCKAPVVDATKVGVANAETVTCKRCAKLITEPAAAADAA